MNEKVIQADLAAKLRLLLPTAVVYRHEDKFTAGIPDISVTWHGDTLWLEVKYYDRPTPVQQFNLDRLNLAGFGAMWVRYEDSGVSVHIRDYVASHDSARGRHEFVIDQVRILMRVK